MEFQSSVVRSFYRCVIVVAVAFGIGSAFLRDLFCVIRRPLPCNVEHDVCKHVDETVTWLCSMSCAMENQARAKILVCIYIYIYRKATPLPPAPKTCVLSSMYTCSMHELLPNQNQMMQFSFKIQF